MIVLDPPNTLRIDRIWMYVSRDEHGNEGVCAGPLMGPGSFVPLIAADQARLAQLTPMAEVIATMTGKQVVLIEFTARTELRTITGRADG